MLQFIPDDNRQHNGKILITVFENENEIGDCEFTINGYEMVFYSINCGDDIVVEGLARAAMNYAANRNAYIAKIPSAISSPAFRRLGFTGEDVLSAEIPEALACSCGCHNAN